MGFPNSAQRIIVYAPSVAVKGLKKSWEIFDKLVQNYSKADFGTVFKNNETFRKILQNYWKMLRKFDGNFEKVFKNFLYKKNFIFDATKTFRESCENFCKTEFWKQNMKHYEII